MEWQRADAIMLLFSPAFGEVMMLGAETDRGMLCYAAASQALRRVRLVVMVVVGVGALRVVCRRRPAATPRCGGGQTFGAVGVDGDDRGRVSHGSNPEEFGWWLLGRILRQTIKIFRAAAIERREREGRGGHMGP